MTKKCIILITFFFVMSTFGFLQSQYQRPLSVKTQVHGLSFNSEHERRLADWAAIAQKKTKKN